MTLARVGASRLWSGSGLLWWPVCAVRVGLVRLSGVGLPARELSASCHGLRVRGPDDLRGSIVGVVTVRLSGCSAAGSVVEHPQVGYTYAPSEVCHRQRKGRVLRGAPLLRHRGSIYGRLSPCDPTRFRRVGARHRSAAGTNPSVDVCASCLASPVTSLRCACSTGVGNPCPLLGAVVATIASPVGHGRPVRTGVYQTGRCYIAVADPAVSAGDGVTPSGADCIIGSSRVVVTVRVDTSVTPCQTT